MTNDNQAGDARAHAILQRTLSEDKTVWVYVNTAKEVGDIDHLKVFACEDAAERWFAEHDPEGVAFEYLVIQ
jgi:hypothetical protein